MALVIWNVNLISLHDEYLVLKGHNILMTFYVKSMVLMQFGINPPNSYFIQISRNQRLSITKFSLVKSSCNLVQYTIVARLRSVHRFKKSLQIG